MNVRHIRKTGLALMAGILLLTGCGSGKEDSVKRDVYKRQKAHCVNFLQK